MAVPEPNCSQSQPAKILKFLGAVRTEFEHIMLRDDSQSLLQEVSNYE
jgi:hypothetical protein